MIHMMIKQPDSDNALVKLWNVLRFLRNRLENCVRQDHNSISILYISSLIIAPNVSYRGIRLIDKIKNLVNTSPRNFICLIRTTTPKWFKGIMRRLQEQSVDYLRDRCYVVLFSRKHEFMNHAKFLIFYHICYSERIVYYGKYYGSTNLTMAGLSGRSGGSRGNYEEFNVTGPRTKFYLSSSDDARIIGEVRYLMVHKALLYTDIHYLRNYLYTHLRQLNNAINRGLNTLSGTTLGELYAINIDLMKVYNQVFSLIDEIPGKLLTNKLEKRLSNIKAPENPFELEMMIPIDMENAELLAKMIDLEDKELRESIRKYIEILKNAYKIISEDYLAHLNQINEYLDDKERSFRDFLKENYISHQLMVNKVLEVAKSSKRI